MVPDVVIKVDEREGAVLEGDGVDREDREGVLLVTFVPIFYPMTLRNPPGKQMGERSTNSQ